MPWDMMMAGKLAAAKRKRSNELKKGLKFSPFFYWVAPVICVPTNNLQNTYQGTKLFKAVGEDTNIKNCRSSQNNVSHVNFFYVALLFLI